MVPDLLTTEQLTTDLLTVKALVTL